MFIVPVGSTLQVPFCSDLPEEPLSGLAAALEMYGLTVPRRCVVTKDVYGVRIYPRSGFLRSGSIKPHRSVRFVAADIRFVTVRDFPKRISDPLRSVAH